MKPAWPSCIVAAPGPSLKPFEHEGIKLIAVNDAYRLFPKADILYAADSMWWRERQPKFAGHKMTCFYSREDRSDLGVSVIPAKPGKYFTFHGAICHGSHSGFQAINIALRLTRLIVLVGFDMKGTHFFGAHKRPLRQKTHFQNWVAQMHEAARLLPKDYRIINATEDSALECFERISLAEALNEARQAGQTHLNTAEDRDAGRIRSAYPDMDADRAPEVGCILSGLGG